MTYTEKMRRSHAALGAGRRNYELIAHVLREAMPPRAETAGRREWYAIVKAFADECAKHWGFDRARFFEAAGIGEDAG